MKTDFRNVLFTDECRATLDGPDGWSSGWILHGRQPGVRIRRQQGGGGVMFWAGIKGDTIIGPFKVEASNGRQFTKLNELWNAIKDVSGQSHLLKYQILPIRLTSALLQS